MHKHKNTHIYIYNTFIRTYTHTYIHIYMHIYTYIYTNKHTLLPFTWQVWSEWHSIANSVIIPRSSCAVVTKSPAERRTTAFIPANSEVTRASSTAARDNCACKRSRSCDVWRDFSRSFWTSCPGSESSRSTGLCVCVCVVRACMYMCMCVRVCIESSFCKHWLIVNMVILSPQ